MALLHSRAGRERTAAPGRSWEDGVIGHVYCAVSWARTDTEGEAFWDGLGDRKENGAVPRVPAQHHSATH